MGDTTPDTFQDPSLAINRVYTRRGDAGETALVGGHRVAKSNSRIDCYGTVDELNALVGAARVSALNSGKTAVLADSLLTVQHQLFNLGSMLATRPADIKSQQPAIRDHEISTLETLIDQFNDGLPELRSFVLPGSSEVDALLHQCRTVCRRAERICVSLMLADFDSLAPDSLVSKPEGDPFIQMAIRYLNRLSDAFFVWGRWTSSALEIPEVLWDPNKAG